MPNSPIAFFLYGCILTITGLLFALTFNIRTVLKEDSKGGRLLIFGILSVISALALVSTTLVYRHLSTPPRDGAMTFERLGINKAVSQFQFMEPVDETRAQVEVKIAAADRETDAPSFATWTSFEWMSPSRFVVKAVADTSGIVRAYSVQIFDRKLNPRIDFPSNGGESHLGLSTFSDLVKLPQVPTTLEIGDRGVLLPTETTDVSFVENYADFNLGKRFVLSVGGRTGDEPAVDQSVQDAFLRLPLGTDLEACVPCVSDAPLKPSFDVFRHAVRPDLFGVVGEGVPSSASSAAGIPFSSFDNGN